jgi:putative flippase GtrA
MKKDDYKIAFAIGAVSGALWFFVLGHLSLFGGWRFTVIFIVPFLFIAIVALAHAIFRGQLFHKIAKFFIVGILNTGIDFFIFNTLIVLTGIDKGFTITLLKSTSFVCAMLNSYALNRAWTFDHESAPAWTKAEFMRFALVTFFGFLINVGTTSLIVNAIHPLFGMSQIRWDNVAAVLATALNFIWNFVGYKVFVFKSKEQRLHTASTNAS